MSHDRDNWHDLSGLAPGFVMLDSTTSSNITPGIEDQPDFPATTIRARCPQRSSGARDLNKKSSSEKSCCWS
jgi:hypothetical protein